MKNSFESSALIAEVKEDIKEFSRDEKVFIVLDYRFDDPYVSNYDFILDEMPIDLDTFLTDTEVLTYGTLSQLLEMMEAQNAILEYS